MGYGLRGNRYPFGHDLRKGFDWFPRATSGSVTHPFIKGFAFPQEHDISLDEIRIECLYETQNNIPGGRVKRE